LPTQVFSSYCLGLSLSSSEIPVVEKSYVICIFRLKGNWKPCYGVTVTAASYTRFDFICPNLISEVGDFAVISWFISASRVPLRLPVP
jgi:hypothetical protein